MQNTEAKAEDGITYRTIHLQGLSNSRIIVNSVETVQPNPEAVETLLVEKKKNLKKKGEKTKNDPLLHANHQVLLRNEIIKKTILLFRKKLESSPMPWQWEKAESR